MQCGGIKFFVIFVCYVISISIKVKFNDGPFRWAQASTSIGVCSIFMHIMGLLAVQKKLVMDGRYASVDCNTNASERGESEDVSFCGYVDQH